MFLKPRSIAKMTKAKISEAIITTIAEPCSWLHEGQLTFFTSSMYDS